MHFVRNLAEILMGICLTIWCTASSAQSTENLARTQLLEALAAAKGGETITLADGNYGTLDIIDHDYSTFVTITSQNRLGAKFDEVNIVNSHHVRIDGIHVNNTDNGGASSTLVAVTKGSSHIEVLNSEVNGRIDDIYDGHFALYTNDSVSSVTFSGNYLHDVKRGGVFYNADNIIVSNNIVDRIGDDSFKFIGVDGVLIENNSAAGHVYPSPGAHLDFIQFQGANSRNITIRGNISLPVNQSNVQGIFLDDADYSNVLIEKNIVVTGMIRGVSVSSGTNIVARHNTVLDIEGAGSKATLVMVPGESYGNIMSTYDEDKRLGETGGNLYLQQTNQTGAWHYDGYFKNAGAGLGLSIEDLAPTQRSLAAVYGAPLSAFSWVMQSIWPL